eukprot:4655856-Pleurochrysis_carterae.AAC.1
MFGDAKGASEIACADSDKKLAVAAKYSFSLLIRIANRVAVINREFEASLHEVQHRRCGCGEASQQRTL